MTIDKQEGERLTDIAQQAIEQGITTLLADGQVVADCAGSTVRNGRLKAYMVVVMDGEDEGGKPGGVGGHIVL